MRRKILITLLFIFVPIAFIEQPKSNSSVKCNDTNNRIGLFLTDTSGYKSTNNLLACKESDIVLIKNCWEEGDLESQKRYCFSKQSGL